MIIDFINTEKKQNSEFSDNLCTENNEIIPYSKWVSETRRIVIEVLHRYLELANDETTDIEDVVSYLKFEVNNLIHEESICLNL